MHTATDTVRREREEDASLPHDVLHRRQHHDRGILLYLAGARDLRWRS